MHTFLFRVGVFTLVAAALSAAAALFVMSSSPTRAGLLKPDDPAVTAQGAQIYAETCAACHGPGLAGEPNWRSPDKDGLMPAPPHDETGHTWHHTEKLLFELTKFGLAEAAGLKDHKTRMPVYDGVLSDDEIIAVLSFIKSRWPQDIQRRHTEMSAHDQ
jgi:mono/diheme cytochrome c family protein